MTNNIEKTNTFEEMEKANIPVKAETSKSNELSLDDFSNVAVGDKVKYNRPDLDDKLDVVDKFQVFMPNPETDEAQKSQSGNSEYWKVSMCLTYKSVNSDDVQNREYISGAKTFKQKDGSMSEPQFWYNGSETQSALLWETVAKAKGIEPERLSPREFIAFLNNRPKVNIISRLYKNYGAAAGSPAKINKNMIEKFI